MHRVSNTGYLHSIIMVSTHATTEMGVRAEKLFNKDVMFPYKYFIYMHQYLIDWNFST